MSPTRTAGEKGYYTFSWRWVEKEQFHYETKAAYQMFATVTMRVRPLRNASAAHIGRNFLIA